MTCRTIALTAVITLIAFEPHSSAWSEPAGIGEAVRGSSWLASELQSAEVADRQGRAFRQDGTMISGDTRNGEDKAPEFELNRQGETPQVIEVQGRRGHEFVGSPRFEPNAGWLAIGSQAVPFGSGEGRVLLPVGDRALRKLHLVADGNSVFISAVRITGADGEPQVAPLQHDLQTGSSASVEILPRLERVRQIEVDFRARSEGSRAPATLTVYGEPAPSR